MGHKPSNDELRRLAAWVFLGIPWLKEWQVQPYRQEFRVLSTTQVGSDRWVGTYVPDFVSNRNMLPAIQLKLIREKRLDYFHDRAGEIWQPGQCVFAPLRKIVCLAIECLEQWPPEWETENYDQ